MRLTNLPHESKKPNSLLSGFFFFGRQRPARVKPAVASTD
jgi:hypothetical protein